MVTAPLLHSVLNATSADAVQLLQDRQVILLAMTSFGCLDLLLDYEKRVVQALATHTLGPSDFLLDH